jgi:hypothetical protein
MLKTLDLSQSEGARELEISERSMRYYCAGEPAPKVIMLAMERLVDLQRRVAGKSSNQTGIVFLSEKSHSIFLEFFIKHRGIKVLCATYILPSHGRGHRFSPHTAHHADQRYPPLAPLAQRQTIWIFLVDEIRRDVFFRAA